MRALSEVERDEIESVKHLIRYVNTKPDCHSSELFQAILELQIIGDKYLLSGVAQENEIEELLDLEDMKDLMQKFLSRVRKDFNIPE